MAPKRKEGPIPTGWTLKTEVQKDGSKISFYYCPDTGQHFYTYADLIRYVEYAKRKRLGVYSVSYKSVRRERHMENNSNATESRKTSSALSIPRRPSNSDSLTGDQSSDSKSSTSSESTDKEKDEDYVPEPEDYVPVDSEVNHESEVIRILRESKRPRANNSARC